MTRPRWHSTARYVGNAPWVPFEVADALQRQVDALVLRGEQAEHEIGRLGSTLRTAETELESQRARIGELETELAETRRDLESLEDAPVPEPEPPPEPAISEDDLERVRARIDELERDVERAHRQRDEALERGRREERVERLASLGSLHDAVRRSIEAAPADGPWADGQRALLAVVEDEFRRAGAEPFGAVGEPFDASIHEAVAVEPGDPSGTIASVVKTGFRLPDGTLVRPASVVVTGDGGRPG